MDLESFVTLVAAAGMTTSFGQQETIPPHEPPTAISYEPAAQSLDLGGKSGRIAAFRNQSRVGL